MTDTNCRICHQDKPLQHVSYWGWICAECKDATEGRHGDKARL
jgi:hypothetical protein